MALKDKINLGELKDGSYWVRIESGTRSPDLEDGLAMRMVDPLWILGRQWQFGAFQGEDNGSPIRTKLHYKTDRFEHIAPLGAEDQAQKLDRDIPLEAQIEAMPVELDLKSRAKLGQKLERLIRQYDEEQASAIIEQLRQDYALEGTGPIDQRSSRFLRLMRNKVIDAQKVLEAMRANPLPPILDAQPFHEFQTYCQSRFVQPLLAEQAVWKKNQLLHQFELYLNDPQSTAAENQLKLSAPDYQSGALDWYSFDQAIGDISEGDQQRAHQSYIPINASFAGMPSQRLFGFEDNQINFGNLDVQTPDLAKAMLIEFALAYGNDWFIVPLEMELGSACWIEKIEVKDVFGVTKVIKNDATTGVHLSANELLVWDVFKIRKDAPTSYDADQHFLYLAPAAHYKQESKPLEEVCFLRDEQANLVWAIEKTVLNALGEAREGFDLHTHINGQQASPSPPARNNDYPRFRLSNAAQVPYNWVPYVPRRIKGSQEIVLRRAQVARDVAEFTPHISSLLSEHKRIREESLPKAGRRLQLTRQRARSTDGRTHLWLGRKVLTGRGEGSSGLRFDYLEV